MKPILVPLHHAPGSLPAVDVAVKVASALDLSVDLVTVQEAGGASADEVIAQAEALLEEAGVARSVVRLSGRPGPAIAHQAEGAGMVIMRSVAHRAPGVDPTKDRRIRSTTLSVLESAPCPVLAVTERVTEMKDALFAYNGSRQSRRAIETAIDLLAPALIKRGTICVATPDAAMAQRLFEEFDELAWSKGVNLRKHSAPGRPGDVLLDRGESSEADLLVMGALGRSWLKEKLFGSTTNRMLRRCPVPIWMAS